MSGPILITVGNLLGKMHNRLPVRRRRFTRHEAMGLHHHGSGQFALPIEHDHVPATNYLIADSTSFELDRSTRTTPRRNEALKSK